ncbi:protein son [Limosa lapponica baueri]|uniref:Protein son n=1 Tax=Limosa lapponica baueri TaxID=1758121 RepID=A0A2I0U3X2_LIMLA|nr:protein son [Limosa lapponica baueri]
MASSGGYFEGGKVEGQPNGDTIPAEQANPSDDTGAGAGSRQNDQIVQKIEEVLSGALDTELQCKSDVDKNTVKNSTKSTKRSSTGEDEIPKKKSKKNKKHKNLQPASQLMPEQSSSKLSVQHGGFGDANLAVHMQPEELCLKAKGSQSVVQENATINASEKDVLVDTGHDTSSSIPSGVASESEIQKDSAATLASEVTEALKEASLQSVAQGGATESVSLASDVITIPKSANQAATAVTQVEVESAKILLGSEVVTEMKDMEGTSDPATVLNASGVFLQPQVLTETRKAKGLRATPEPVAVVQAFVPQTAPEIQMVQGPQAAVEVAALTGPVTVTESKDSEGVKASEEAVLCGTVARGVEADSEASLLAMKVGSMKNLEMVVGSEASSRSVQEQIVESKILTDVKGSETVEEPELHRDIQEAVPESFHSEKQEHLQAVLEAKPAAEWKSSEEALQVLSAAEMKSSEAVPETGDMKDLETMLEHEVAADVQYAEAVQGQQMEDVRVLGQAQESDEKDSAGTHESEIIRDANQLEAAPAPVAETEDLETAPLPETVAGLKDAEAAAGLEAETKDLEAAPVPETVTEAGPVLEAEASQSEVIPQAEAVKETTPEEESEKRDSETSDVQPDVAARMRETLMRLEKVIEKSSHRSSDKKHDAKKQKRSRSKSQSRSRSVEKRERRVSSRRSRRRRSRSSDHYRSKSRSVEKRLSSRRSGRRRSRSSDRYRSKSRSVEKRLSSRRSGRRRSRSSDRYRSKSRSRSVEKRGRKASLRRSKHQRSKSSDRSKSVEKKKESSRKSKRRRSKSSERYKSRSRSVEKKRINGPELPPSSESGFSKTSDSLETSSSSVEKPASLQPSVSELSGTFENGSAEKVVALESSPLPELAYSTSESRSSSVEKRGDPETLGTEFQHFTSHEHESRSTSLKETEGPETLLTLESGCSVSSDDYKTVSSPSGKMEVQGSSLMSESLINSPESSGCFKSPDGHESGSSFAAQIDELPFMPEGDLIAISSFEKTQEVALTTVHESRSSVDKDLDVNVEEPSQITENEYRMSEDRCSVSIEGQELQSPPIEKTEVHEPALTYENEYAVSWSSLAGKTEEPSLTSDSEYTIFPEREGLQSTLAEKTAMQEPSLMSDSQYAASPEGQELLPALTEKAEVQECSLLSENDEELQSTVVEKTEVQELSLMSEEYESRLTHAERTEDMNSSLTSENDHLLSFESQEELRFPTVGKVDGLEPLTLNNRASVSPDGSDLKSIPAEKMDDAMPPLVRERECSMSPDGYSVKSGPGHELQSPVEEEVLESSLTSEHRRSVSPEDHDQKSVDEEMDDREPSLTSEHRRSTSPDEHESRSSIGEEAEYLEQPLTTEPERRDSTSSDEHESRSTAGEDMEDGEPSLTAERRHSTSSDDHESRSTTGEEIEDLEPLTAEHRHEHESRSTAGEDAEDMEPSLTAERRDSTSSDEQESRSTTAEEVDDVEPSLTAERRDSTSSDEQESRSTTESSRRSISRRSKSPTRQKSRSTSFEKVADRESSRRSRRRRSRSAAQQKSRSTSVEKTADKESSRRSRRRRSSRSRTPIRQRRSRSRGRRRSSSRSPIRLRRSRSSGRRRYSRSPDRRRSRSSERFSSRSPKRLTDLDKAQLLEIAKANAAAMCAKSGVPLPPSLMPLLSQKKDDKANQKSSRDTLKELTEKCKKIAQSTDDVIVNKPHVSDEEEEERPFYNHPFKLSEPKPIFFNLSTPSIKPAPPPQPKNQVSLSKEFPVSSGSQHRKKEADSVYGEWVPVEKGKDDGKDDVFPKPSIEGVDITTAMNDRALAQKRLNENTFDLEAMCMLNRAQEQIDAWAQSNSIPGQFTGSTGAQILSSDELTNSGPQAWIRKVPYSHAHCHQTHERTSSYSHAHSTKCIRGYTRLVLFLLGMVGAVKTFTKLRFDELNVESPLVVRE